ncbi:unnamed protein product [Cylicocyclus nassatus]|uniref:Uncharacterized protein n=1 Tax=Cylicocyclus nassatus TaxID=53992 RepID=A0AA36DN45_CYLNA|nr:unnamed protein product [Cylicocyclus nassatus]
MQGTGYKYENETLYPQRGGAPLRDRPPSTYALYAKLTFLHRNALRNAEIAGERVVKRSTIVHRKFKARPSIVVEKTPMEHIWRTDSYMEFVKKYFQGTQDDTGQETEKM